MYKLSVSLVALLGMTSATYAGSNVTATVEDVYTTMTTSQPYNETVCENVQVPVYRERQQQGNAAGSALLGMVIGGALGDVISDGNGNATAAGAVMGGLVGADRGARTRTTREVAGHRTERQCNEVTRYRDVQSREYDYSILHFMVDGVRYQTTFDRY